MAVYAGVDGIINICAHVATSFHGAKLQYAAVIKCDAGEISLRHNKKQVTH